MRDGDDGISLVFVAITDWYATEAYRIDALVWITN